MLDPDPGALAELVERATGHRPTSVVPMAGGASTRRYLRVATPGGSAAAGFSVVMDSAPGGSLKP